MVVCSPEKMQAVLKRQTFDTGERRLRTAQSSLFVVVAHSPPHPVCQLQSSWLRHGGQSTDGRRITGTTACRAFCRVVQETIF